MKRMIKYNKIGDFKRVVRSIKDQAKHDRVTKLPTIEFDGTEKIHGINAAVCYSNIDGFWVQSRVNILTLTNDNSGCAFAVYQNEKAWMDLILAMAKSHNINLDEEIISIYYEWGGGSIQRKSALTGLGKRAIIFAHAKVSPLLPDSNIVESEHQPAYWVDTIDSDGNYIMDPECDIYNILAYENWKITIDFNGPELAVNGILKTLHDNESNSHIGKYMGIENNIFEGIVWTGRDNNGDLLKFKVKGEKHTNSKVKTLKLVDDVKEQAKNDFACLVTNAGRLEQAWQYFFGANCEKKRPEKSDIPDFLRWVHKDIMDEHMADYFEANIEPKEINGKISKIARMWFLEQYDIVD